MEIQPIEVISSADSMRSHNDQRITRRATEDFDILYEKMKELAEGYWAIQKLPDGSQTRVYKKPPDQKALAYLLDRAAGKQQPTEDGASRASSSGLISLQHIIKQLGDGKPTPSRLSEGTGVQDVLE